VSMADRTKIVAYTCPYVPAEWIAAHGLQPLRLIPLPVEGAATISRIEGLCPYARAFVNDVVASQDIDGIVVTTMCDQMRRVFDLLVRRVDVPAFLLNVPSTWQTVAAQRLYLDELKRLGRFLVRLGGHEPTKEDLIRAMLDPSREAAPIDESVGWVLNPRVPPIDAPGACGLRTHPTRAAHDHPEGVPLALVGGPLMQRDRVLFEIVRECGGQIVLDATETGQRGLPGVFDRRRLIEDPLMELAETYFRIPDAARRPNSELYQWLQDQLAQAGARGILFHHYIWCDKWHAEFARLQEWVKLPVLRLDSEGDGAMSEARLRSRVRAFMEMFS
jgi:benzoyl-CoA reductase/2-hydroxyglutaryl-CoA dehydratase subunit BcrC/BadD/HgdB